MEPSGDMAHTKYNKKNLSMYLLKSQSKYFPFPKNRQTFRKGMIAGKSVFK